MRGLPFLGELNRFAVSVFDQLRWSDPVAWREAP
jgi:hypothetical protein